MKYLEILVSNLPNDNVLRAFAVGSQNNLSGRFELSQRLSNTGDRIMIKVANERRIPSGLLALGTLHSLAEAKIRGRSDEYRNNHEELQVAFDSFVTNGLSDIEGRTLTENDYDLDKLDQRLSDHGLDRTEIDRIKQSLSDRQTR